LLHTLLIQLSIIYKCGDLRLPRRTALFDRQAVDGASTAKIAPIRRVASFASPTDA
jgi:hypothetical protein